MSAIAPLLSVRGLCKSFGGLAVTCDVDFDVAAGSRVAMIGPNGAGKTTLFNLLSGVERPDAGTIVFDGRGIVDVASRRRIALGMARSFQNIRLMPHLSVIENVMLGQHAQIGRNLRALLSPASLSRRSPWRRAAEHKLHALGVTAFDASVDSLPYGVRKKIEVVRALMSGPKLLLLDEPAAGLNPTETAALRDFLHAVSDDGVTLLVVEHDMSFVRKLCPQAVVLNFGRKIYDGPTARVHEDAAVVEAYLGHPRATAVMLLDAAGLDVRFGRTHALKGVSVSVAAGEIVTVLGANGAGKTTLLRAVQGAVRPHAGRIRFDGRDITDVGSPRRVRGGLSLVPEGRQIFVGMTIEENLRIGADLRRDGDVTADIARIYERFPNLANRRAMPARVLSGGEQQMLAIGRALLSRPRLMMLDEPSLGLSPLLVDQLFDLLRELNRDGLAILLVEQNTQMALDLAARGYVLERGDVVMQGDAPALARDPALATAYLGAEDALAP